MAKDRAVGFERVIHDSGTGRHLAVRGVGALKGRLAIKKSVDLTKPIAAQTMNKRKDHSTDAKH